LAPFLSLFITHTSPAPPPFLPLPSYLPRSFLASRLADLGICHFFGVPGDFNLALLDELISEPRLRMISTCNELNAGWVGGWLDAAGGWVGAWGASEAGVWMMDGLGGFSIGTSAREMAGACRRCQCRLLLPCPAWPAIPTHLC
jgi:hypothetical protein